MEEDRAAMKKRRRKRKKERKGEGEEKEESAKGVRKEGEERGGSRKERKERGRKRGWGGERGRRRKKKRTKCFYKGVWYRTVPDSCLGKPNPSGGPHWARKEALHIR